MKILIIKDEKELSKSIAAYLKVESYSCEMASDLKISLPDGNGLQVLRELKTNCKTVIFI